MSDQPVAYIPARAARGKLVHKLPVNDAGQLTSRAAACGWTPVARHGREVRWYQATEHGGGLCSACFPGAPL